MQFSLVFLTNTARTLVLTMSCAGIAVTVFGSAAGATPPATRPLKTTSPVESIHEQLGLHFSVFESYVRRSIISTRTPYGLKIRYVAPESLAAVAGLRAGDIVMRVDGRPLRTLAGLAEKLEPTTDSTTKGTDKLADNATGRLADKDAGRLADRTITLQLDVARRKGGFRRGFAELKVQLAVPRGNPPAADSRKHEPAPERRRRQI